MTNKFPFGQLVTLEFQKDESPKKVFVLDSFPSAVYAKWVMDTGTVYNLLPVASEPSNLWYGDAKEAIQIIENISIPDDLGSLSLPDKEVNGIKNRIILNNILKPMYFHRYDVWMCYLSPDFKMNDKQKKLLKKRYEPLMKNFCLNDVTIPLENSISCDRNRVLQITSELIQSRADYLILLGDLAIQYYLRNVFDFKFRNLRDYSARCGYGKPFKARIGSKDIEVILLASPNQIMDTSRRNAYWYNAHKTWENSEKIVDMRTSYYFIKDLELVGKCDGMTPYIYRDNEWQFDYLLMDRIIGYDETEQNTPYWCGNSDIMRTVERISKDDVKRILGVSFSFF